MKDYDDQSLDKFGVFGFELFRIDVDGEYDDIYLSVQYRWYADFEAIHHAFFGYRISPDWDVHLGIHQVPFGIMPYASHSFWFGATYYLGLEDDYDMGLKAMYKKGPFELQLAFYKNTEYVDASRSARYSFDLVTSGEQLNEEINQGNLRLGYKWIPQKDWTIDLGTSFEIGQIYNQETRKNGYRQAFAIHADIYYKTWNIQLQGIDYLFKPENPQEVSAETVQMGAFLYPFLVASEAKVVSVNFAKDFSFNWRLLDRIKLYVDMSKVWPGTENGRTSTQIVTGFLLIKKGLYTFVDVITGQNMWFAGGPGIGLNNPDFQKWNSRLNINFGFYF